MIENVFPMHCYSHDYSLICLVAHNKVWYEKWHYLKTPLTCTNMHRYALLQNKWQSCHMEKMTFWKKAGVIWFVIVDITTESELDICCIILCCIWPHFLHLSQYFSFLNDLFLLIIFKKSIACCQHALLYVSYSHILVLKYQMVLDTLAARDLLGHS